MRPRESSSESPVCPSSGGCSPPVLPSGVCGPLSCNEEEPTALHLWLWHSICCHLGTQQNATAGLGAWPGLARSTGQLLLLAHMLGQVNAGGAAKPAAPPSPWALAGAGAALGCLQPGCAAAPDPALPSCPLLCHVCCSVPVPSCPLAAHTADGWNKAGHVLPRATIPGPPCLLTSGTSLVRGADAAWAP